MIKILFICHGNICRSPMAEFLMNHLISKENLENEIRAYSAATSSEEIGNDIHYGTRNILIKHNIPFQSRHARKVTKEDYNNYNYLIVMDNNNMRNLKRIIPNDSENKIYKLLSFSEINRDIADPWYTDDFDTTYKDIFLGCSSLLKHIIDSLNKQ